MEIEYETLPPSIPYAGESSVRPAIPNPGASSEPGEEEEDDDVGEATIETAGM